MEDINDLSRYYAPLPDDALNALAHRARTGDTQARDLMVLHNMRLVVHFSKQFMNARNSEDIMSEGMIGLMQAVDRYDPDRGFKFSTYATWWIRQAVQREIYSSTPLHLSQRDHEALPAIRRAMEHNVREGDHQLQRYLSIIYPSLDQAVRSGDDENLTLGQLLRDPRDDYADIDERSARDERIEHILAVLDHKEREVVSLYYGLHNDQPLKIREIAVKCGVSRQAVDVRYRKAMKKLRASSDRKDIAS